MQVKSMMLGIIGTNCYIFWDDNSKECAVVDPGAKGEKPAALIRELGLKPVGVLLTHSHFDHILGIPGLRAVWPDLPVYCHRLDIPQELTQVTFGVESPTVTAFGNLTPYEEGDTVDVGPLKVEVLHTPGHTSGSVTLKVEDALFTGDTLFRGSMGRTDLGGNYAQMMASLRRLAGLPGDFKVYPGHEGFSTLEAERACNPCIREARGG